jgi:DNA polymerase V
MVLPYFDGKVPAGFPSPAEDYLETPLGLTEYLIENRAATFMMRVDGDSMKDAGILDGDLLVVYRSA